MCDRDAPDYSGNSYLGIHMDMEKIEGLVLNAELQMTYSAVVRFDVDLHEYNTTGGANARSEPNEYEINPVMYIKALDMLLNCLATQGADMHSVAAISCGTHHHGAIYWSLAGFRALCGLSPKMRLHEQLTEKSFALPTLYWMNDSLEKQCVAMEDQVDPIEIQKITGSKPSVRTTGPEIRKIYEVYPEKYEQTVRISLISSFLASLLIGNIASIDYTDGSKMNLLDIGNKSWSPECLEACAPDLQSRLMQPIATNRLQGRIAKYHVNRWNFRPDCMIVAATAISASMLSSVREQKDFLILSLSKSDRIIMHFKDRPVVHEGCVMCHPTMPDEYMGSFIFRNGSAVRERICREVAQGKWSVFNEMLAATPKGNAGHIAIHFDEMEYLPEACGSLRWDSDINELLEEALHGRQQFPEPRFEARAVIEGQLLHHRAAAASMGLSFSAETKIIVTNDCSSNDSILQIVADIFNASVYRLEGPTEASVLGAAYRARYAFYQHREVNCNCRRCKILRGRQPQLSYAEFFQRTPDNLKLVAQPTPGCNAIYDPMMLRCMRMCQLMAASKSIDESRIKYSDDNSLRPL
ncbi:xylulose kinase [Drosophila montana]|uniref:xylulose kinase n=1 Tax=Drosophila montana TaxID=40370 RepID=UPI00313F31D9